MLRRSDIEVTVRFQLLIDRLARSQYLCRLDITTRLAILMNGVRVDSYACCSANLSCRMRELCEDVRWFSRLYLN